MPLAFDTLCLVLNMTNPILQAAIIHKLIFNNEVSNNLGCSDLLQRECRTLLFNQHCIAKRKKTVSFSNCLVVSIANFTETGQLISSRSGAGIRFNIGFFQKGGDHNE